jgi:hypothetical protein
VPDDSGSNFAFRTHPLVATLRLLGERTSLTRYTQGVATVTISGATKMRPSIDVTACGSTKNTSRHITFLSFWDTELSDLWRLIPENPCEFFH